MEERPPEAPSSSARGASASLREAFADRGRLLALSRPLLVVIPIGALIAVIAHAAFERAQYGWRGAYYSTPDLTGQPTVRRDPSLLFRWFDDAPLPDMPTDGFSVRWETCLTVGPEPALEAYLGSDDGMRVTIDGEVVDDRFHDQAFAGRHLPVHLEPGRHHVVVEYYDRRSEAHAMLRFQEPGLVSRPLPLDRYRLPEEEPGEAGPCP